MLGSAAAAQGVADELLQYGPGGLIALIIGGFSYYQLKIERLRGDRERDRADAERTRADEAAVKFVGLIERILPALAESTRATQDVVDVLRRDRR